MSHRKVYSQGSIPFSWEDMPGVSKAIHQDTGLHVLNLSSSSSPNTTSSIPHDSDTSSLKVSSAHQDKKIPLPPCQNLQLPPGRSTSAKVGSWQEDPFIAAYKECTKNVRNGNKPQPSEKKKNVTGSKGRKSRLILSCKNSCDVTDDNLVRLSNLPPIPRYRVRG
ncbi:hypothetical protein P3X46_018634 [Hevea brasiliensis]|uniref:Uncharacterized protein n=1 Tax=Hevea brasiliensis TaxID=3981 RepID=A0ABQ9LTA2_HEVBR|nr:hypothetical protein P3X46_018634 [Hevea brasiliensis]